MESLIIDSYYMNPGFAGGKEVSVLYLIELSKFNFSVACHPTINYKSRYTYSKYFHFH